MQGSVTLSLHGIFEQRVSLVRPPEELNFRVCAPLSGLVPASL